LRLPPFFAVLFLLFPVIEIWLLIKVGGAIGVFPTILLLILSGMLGMFVLRQQGLATLARFQRSVNEGTMPAQAMLESVVSLVGGLLLIIPGFFTDMLGLLCLFPPTRFLILKVFLSGSQTYVQTRTVHYTQTSSRRPQSPQQTDYDIEGEVVSRKDDD
jgi:UPF0716 protein FxsA